VTAAFELPRVRPFAGCSRVVARVRSAPEEPLWTARKRKAAAHDRNSDGHEDHAPEHQRPGPPPSARVNRPGQGPDWRRDRHGAAAWPPRLVGGPLPSGPNAHQTDSSTMSYPPCVGSRRYHRAGEDSTAAGWAALTGAAKSCPCRRLRGESRAQKAWHLVRGGARPTGLG